MPSITGGTDAEPSAPAPAAAAAAAAAGSVLAAGESTAAAVVAAVTGGAGTGVGLPAPLLSQVPMLLSDRDTSEEHFPTGAVDVNGQQVWLV